MRQRSQWVELFISCCRQLVLQLREIGSHFSYIKRENAQTFQIGPCKTLQKHNLMVVSDPDPLATDIYHQDCDCSYPINESLVKLLHGSLQLAALMLPLLIVSHRFLCRTLPSGSSGYVVHIIHPTHRIHPAFPPTHIKEKELSRQE